MFVDYFVTVNKKDECVIDIRHEKSVDDREKVSFRDIGHENISQPDNSNVN